MLEVLVNKKNKTNSELVGIESLPANLIEKILTYLPINEAVQTSLISRAWRYRWRHMPDLVFNNYFSYNRVDEEEQEHEEEEEEKRERKLVLDVYRGLLLHVGKIRMFKVASRLRSFYELDTWMHVLRNADIQKLILHLTSSTSTLGKHNMPSTLFSCNNLKYLELANCCLEIPHCFKGFNNLNTVIFTSVEFKDVSTLMTLTRHCPRLQCLSLTICDGFSDLNIVSTTLLECSLDRCPLYSLQFDAPMLASVKLTMDQEEYGSLDLINGLPNLQHLELLAFSLEGFGESLRNTMVPFQRLKTLFVEKYNCLKQTTVLLHMLRICPTLESLHIFDFEPCFFVPEIPIPKFWKVEENLSFNYNCLKNFKINCQCEDATAVIELVLPNAPLLSGPQPRSGDMFYYCSSQVKLLNKYSTSVV